MATRLTVGHNGGYCLMEIAVLILEVSRVFILMKTQMFHIKKLQEVSDQ